MILLPLLFYVKSNLGEFKWSKNISFGILKTQNFEFLVNLGLESCLNLLKSISTTSKIAKNDIFGLFDVAKIGFYVRFEWR